MQDGPSAFRLGLADVVPVEPRASRVLWEDRAVTAQVPVWTTNPLTFAAGYNRRVMSGLQTH